MNRIDYIIIIENQLNKILNKPIFENFSNTLALNFKVIFQVYVPNDLK